MPETAGVYFVTRPVRIPLRVLPRNPAGRFKGRNPTLPVSELRKRLRTNHVTLYIGKASGLSLRSTLRHRIATYLRHGSGQRAAHWGGRAIWQLANSESFTIMWIETSRREARQLERRFLRDFKDLFGAYPFANRTG